MNKKKVRNSLVVLLACSAGLLTSCVSDELPSGTTTDANKLSVVFSVGDAPLTKADMAPTSNEALVAKCHVALFDQNGNFIADADPTYSALDATYKTTFNDVDVESLVKSGTKVQAVVVANSDLNFSTCKTLDQFNALIETTDPIVASTLVKEGVSELYTLSATGSNQIPVTLTQLAAKVKVAFSFEGAATGDTWTFTPTAYTVTGTNSKSKVMLGNAQSTTTNNQFTAASVISKTNLASTDSVMFYSYEIPTLSATQKVVVSMTGTLHGVDAHGNVIKNATKNYKMVLDGSSLAALKHGNYYIGTGKIDIKDESIHFTVTVKDWISVEVGANIKDVHYLAVSEHNIYMPNINTYTFKYASDLNVTSEITSVSYTGYDTDGNAVTGTYQVGDDQYPTITINADKTITVSFKHTPINYVPTHIVLKVKTTTEGLVETVNVTHYPTPYVEVFYNNNESNLPEEYQDWAGVPSNLPGGRTYDGDQTNYNLFQISSIASGNFVIGNPRDTDGTTKMTEEANNLVSPKFVIASQRGITSPLVYSSAKQRCSQYTEYPYLTPGTWRIPTTAELIYVAQLQGADGSAVVSLLEGESYWSAYYVDGNGKYVNMDNATTGFSSSSTYVRCVHDVY